MSEIDFRDRATSSELYEAKLNFIVLTLTQILYEQGYAPFSKGLIQQIKLKSIPCTFADVLNFEYGLCVDPEMLDRSVINNDSSLSENVYRSAYNLEGKMKEFLKIVNGVS